MHSVDSVMIDAPAATIYRLAAAIEKWPTILPHYRWVTLFRDDGQTRLVEMAATRDGGFPVKWTSGRLTWETRSSFKPPSTRATARTELPRHLSSAASPPVRRSLARSQALTGGTDRWSTPRNGCALSKPDKRFTGCLSA